MMYVGHIESEGVSLLRNGCHPYDTQFWPVIQHGKQLLRRARRMLSHALTLTLTMDLPAELIDHIFSYLQTDIPSLKACSEAHPLYSSLAERHIYARIVSESGYCNDILENPRLLYYPRTLEIRFTRKPLVISIISLIPRMANLVSQDLPAVSVADLNFSQHLGTASSNRPYKNFTFSILYMVYHFLFSTMPGVSSSWRCSIA